jgi:hypothetical protein
MASATINIVSADYSEGIPLLSFPQGVPIDIRDAEVTVFQSGEDKKRKREVIATCNKLELRGIDYKQHSARHDTLNYAIGVLDESTNTLNVYAATHAYVMQPVFKDRVSQLKSDATYAERIRASTEAFGSKKKKKSLKAADNNIISAENIVAAKEVTQSILDSTKDVPIEVVASIQSAAEDALEQHRRKMLPPYNLQALSVEEAYPVSTLVPNDVMMALIK